MKNTFIVNPETHDCMITFELQDFKGLIDFKNALALVIMICGDYNIDPELDVKDLENLIIENQDKKIVTFFINEEEVEAEFN